MRVKFQDVECYRDYEYEYSDDEDPALHKEFTVWNPLSLDEIKKEEEKPEPVKEAPAEIDIYTEMFAEELGLRSLKNQSSISDVEELDLSFLDYDAIDVLEKDTDMSLNFTDEKGKIETSIPKSNALNETLFPNLKEADTLNLTAVNLQTQSIRDNSIHMQNSSMPSTTAIVHNTTALSVVGNVSKQITNFTATLQGNSSSLLETERMNVTLTGDNQTSVDRNLAEGSEERLTRGDVFFYSPLSNLSTNNLHSTPEGNVTSLSHSTKEKDENNTATNHVDVSVDETNHSLCIPVADVGKGGISTTNRCNLTIFELEVESTDNNTSDSNFLNTTAEPAEYRLQKNSSEIVTYPTNSSLENITHIFFEAGPLPNVTVTKSISNSSGEISLESTENVTALHAKLNHTSSVLSFSNDTMVSGNLSLSSDAVRENNSGELSASDSSEEVFIYLKENNTDFIKTTSVQIQGHNWTYEEAHQRVPMEIPDYMKKYFEKETPQTTPTPKKIRKVSLRQRPQKGQGMKTKKRKDYKAQARSGLPFSPRGFNPGMTPRGSRPLAPQPVSDEEELINMPVVIGVPRPDFSDYELYVPGDEPDHLGLDEQNVKDDEYEYVMYKDPYSSREDIKNFSVDETTKYYLKFSGPNVKIHFIAAEEVEWDFAGYGQR